MVLCAIQNYITGRGDTGDNLYRRNVQELERPPTPRFSHLVCNHRKHAAASPPEPNTIHITMIW